MFVRNIINTTITKSLVLIVNFGLILITTHFWGAEGRGIISLLVADVAIVSILANVLAGSGITYYIPKMGVKNMLLPAWLWIAVTTVAGSWLLNLTHDQGYLIPLIIISFLTGIIGLNNNIFLGKEMISQFNWYTLLRPLILMAFVLFFIFFTGIKDVQAYYYGFYCSLSVLILISTLQVFNIIRTDRRRTPYKTIFKELLKYGWLVQLSFFMQFLNYRLSYYFLSHFEGLASVGVFSIGIAIAEAVWVISRSTSVVLYSKIVNTETETEQISNVKLSLRISSTATIAALIVLIIIPAKLYALIFGPEFSHVREVILYLIPGIFAIAVSNIIGHYYSATGKLKILNVKSLLGLIVTIGLSFLLIPLLKIQGACIAASASYLTSSIYLFYQFYRQVPFDPKDFFIRKNDLGKLYALILKKGQN